MVINLTEMDVFKSELSIAKMFLNTLNTLNTLNYSRCCTKVVAQQDRGGHGWQDPGQLGQGVRVQVRAEHCQDVALHPRQIIR